MRRRYNLGDVYGDYTVIDHVKVACGRPTKVNHPHLKKWRLEIA